MEDIRISTSAPNLVNICVDGVTGGNVYGRLWDHFHECPRQFESAADLLRKIDEMMNEIDFPQESTVVRSFDPPAQREGPKHRNGKEVKNMTIQDERGGQATFIVQIKYRQNATWQGDVVWAEQNRKVYFRSALELMKIIDSATAGGQPDESKWPQQSE